MLSLMFEKDIRENFLYRPCSLYTKQGNPLVKSLFNLPWFISALCQSRITMGVAYTLTGEAFLPSEGMDYEQRYLFLLAYTAWVFISSFYMAYQTNTCMYYGLLLIIRNINLLIAFTACLQSETAFSRVVGTMWTGFFGEYFNSFPSLVMLLTMFLAAVAPSWVGVTVWSESYANALLIVFENETTAATEDRPLFFDSPRSNKQ
jgi:hypothetical protein